MFLLFRFPNGVPPFIGDVTILGTSLVYIKLYSVPAFKGAIRSEKEKPAGLAFDFALRTQTEPAVFALNGGKHPELLPRRGTGVQSAGAR